MNAKSDRPMPVTVTTQLPPASDAQKAAVHDTLRLLGADFYDMTLPETRCLPGLLKPGEQLLGVLFGKYSQSTTGVAGRGMVAATNRRLLLIDKKLLFLHYGELGYEHVAGVACDNVGPGFTVTVSTRLGDYIFHTFNRKCATLFVQAVERQIFNHKGDQL